TVRLWEARDGRELHSFELQVEVLGVAFNRDGKQLAAGTVPGRSVGNVGQGHAVVWDIASRTQIATLHGHSSGIHAVAFDKEGRLATAGIDGLVKIWDVGTREALVTCRNNRRAPVF